MAQGSAIAADAKELVIQLRGVGWSLQDVAEALEVSWFTVYRWSRGQHAPRPAYWSALRRLAVRAGVA